MAAFYRNTDKTKPTLELHTVLHNLQSPFQNEVVEVLSSKYGRSLQVLRLPQKIQKLLGRRSFSCLFFILAKGYQLCLSVFARIFVALDSTNGSFFLLYHPLMSKNTVFSRRNFVRASLGCRVLREWQKTANEGYVSYTKHQTSKGTKHDTFKGKLPFSYSWRITST